MSAEEIVEKYSGTFPDYHRRPPFRTWNELNAEMQKDIEEYGRLKWQQACEEQIKSCAEGINPYYIRLDVLRAPKPEFKP